MNRELLETIAKLLGLTLYEHRGRFYTHYVDDRDACGSWDPTKDDGECAKMESALGINVTWSLTCVTCKRGNIQASENFDEYGGDRDAARRVASTRCAANIHF